MLDSISNTRILNNLINLWLNKFFIQTKIHDILWWLKYDSTITQNHYTSLSIDYHSILKYCWFNNIFDFKTWENLEFLWKSISDIWWWFSWLPLLIWDNVNEINIIDPLFYNNNLNEILDTQINNIRNLLIENRKLLINPNKKDIIEIIKKNIKIKENILNNLINRKTLKINKTKLNPSNWEDIIWIENNSQDYVFLINIINQNNINPYAILSEAYRITKPWWEIIILFDTATEYMKTDILFQITKISKKIESSKWCYLWIIKK